MPAVTRNAVERYQERFADLPADRIVSYLQSPPFKAAADFGAPYVRLPGRQRVVLRNQAVVTVLPSDFPECRLARCKDPH